MEYSEFIIKYGQIKVEFKSYYKYVFTYTGKLKGGAIIEICVGGDSSDIYRHSVEINEKLTVNSLFPTRGSVTKNGIVIDDFDDC